MEDSSSDESPQETAEVAEETEEKEHGGAESSADGQRFQPKIEGSHEEITAGTSKPKEGDSQPAGPGKFQTDNDRALNKHQAT